MNTIFALLLPCLIGGFAPGASTQRDVVLPTGTKHATRSIARFKWDRDMDAPIRLSIYRETDGKLALVSATKWDVFTTFFAFGAAKHKSGTIFLWASADAGQVTQTYIWIIREPDMKPRLALTALSPDMRHIQQGRLTDRSIARWVENPPAHVTDDTEVVRRWHYDPSTRKFVPGHWVAHRYPSALTAHVAQASYCGP